MALIRALFSFLGRINLISYIWCGLSAIAMLSTYIVLMSGVAGFTLFGSSNMKFGFEALINIPFANLLLLTSIIITLALIIKRLWDIGWTACIDFIRRVLLGMLKSVPFF